MQKLTKYLLNRFSNSFNDKAQDIHITNDQLEWVLDYLLSNQGKTMNDLSWMFLYKKNNDISPEYISKKNINKLIKLFKMYKYTEFPSSKLNPSDL